MYLKKDFKKVLKKVFKKVLTTPERKFSEKMRKKTRPNGPRNLADLACPFRWVPKPPLNSPKIIIFGQK